MKLDKNNLVAFVTPYKASSRSPSLVITLPKFFTELLTITPDTEIMLKVNKKTKEITLSKLDNTKVMELLRDP